MPNWVGVIAVVSMVFIGLLVVVELFVTALLLMAIKNLLLAIRERAAPLIDRTGALLITASQTAEAVREKAERIATKAAETTDAVGTRVENTSRLLQMVLAAPLVGGMAALAGLRQGVATWRKLRRRHRQTARRRAPAPPRAEEAGDEG